ncbi:MAG: proline dehydrogenase family protein [Nitrospira sp.]|nr:proline dehydrogenase family protein [Nitrospira sp.]MDH4369997.1 proline dehydrogenase family protein [Nitrospira sp.]
MKWGDPAIVHVPMGEASGDEHGASEMYTEFTENDSPRGPSMTPSPSLEAAILRIGEQLAQLSSGLSPSIFDSRWWSQSAINLAMKDASFKTRLFHFIDVLPVIEDDGRVVSLAEEYFGRESGELFGLQWGFRALTSTGIGVRLTGKSIRKQIEQMAKTFIAGASVDEAIPALSQLWGKDRAWSVDLLGEATISEQEADRYRDRCLNALTELGQVTKAWPSSPLLERDHLGQIPRVQLSLKISALSSKLDPIDPDGSYESVAARLRPLVDRARELSAGLIFDMEQAETKSLILDIFKRLFNEPAYRSYPYAGLALQAYHRNTERDIQDLVGWVRDRGVPITIRLVKGAYWDSDTVRYRQAGWPSPLFELKAETDRNYERLIPVLFEHIDLIRPAFGTHNLRTLAAVEAHAELLDLPPDAREYQMIFGMAEPFQQAMVKLGRRVRLYAPVGRLLPGMAYLVRRLLENTSNESFLKKEYVESQPLPQLLAPPQTSPLHPPLNTTKHARSFANEPHGDFSQTDVREAMHAGIVSVRSQLGRRWEYSTSDSRLTGPWLESRNSCKPEEVVAQVQSAAISDLNPAIDQALHGWESWRRTGPEVRSDILRKAAAEMSRRRYELAAWEIFEVGKPWREAEADVAEAIDFLRYYADEMDRLAQSTRFGDYPGELNHRIYGPRGLTAVIAPWNFPLAIPAGMISAALVTGNPVLFKPSERSPHLGALLTDILIEAGVPADCLICLPGGPDIGQALIAHPHVATIVFTGSKTVGLHILNETSRLCPGQTMIKRVIAEMGGKNAIIVGETADLDEAIAGVVTSFSGYAGQKCSACSRVIVHRAVYDPFVARLREAVLSLEIGDPVEPGTRVGPVIDARAQAGIQRHISIGREEGRMLVQCPVGQEGYFVGPTVFVDIQSHHRLAQEEIFGPVLAVMKADSFVEAIRMANETDYALTGGVYTRSPANLAIAREQFDVGNLYLNRPITGALVSRQPFGGHRFSGIGAKAGGEDYLVQFMISRVVSENTLRRGFESIQ